MNDSFQIDRESAEELYAVLCDDDQLSPEAFKLAFTNVLSRKMGADNAPAECSKEDTDTFARAERMFDRMFTVEVEGMSDKEVATQAAKASVHLLEMSVAEATKGDKEMSDMYGGDLTDYMLIRAYLEDGDVVKAYDKWTGLDTASRDNLFIDLDKEGEAKLNKALSRYNDMRREAAKQAA